MAPVPWLWRRYFRLFARMVNRSIDDQPLATLLPVDWITRTEWGNHSLGNAIPEDVEKEAMEALLRSCHRPSQGEAVISMDLEPARLRCSERWKAVRNRLEAAL